MRTRFRSVLVLLLAVTATTLGVAVPGAAEAATGAKWGYVMDDNPFATTNYTPSLDIARQSNGKRATIQHNGVGTYTVTFPGLAATGNTGVVHVTEMGTPGSCQTSGWRNSSGNVLVGVLCFAPGGAPADGFFFATYAVGSGTRAFAYAQDTRATTSGALPSTSSFDGLGGSLTSTRHAVGSYTVTIPHQAGANGTVKLTPVGTAQTICTVGRWGRATVDLHCADAAGHPKDSAFDLTFANRLSLLGVPRTGGYLWNSSADQTYTDSDAYSFNSTGGGVSVSHVGTGYYQLQFTGFASEIGGHAQATAYGSSGLQCNISSAFAEGPATEDVYVQCRDSAGSPVDSLFTMQFVM